MADLKIHKPESTIVAVDPGNKMSAFVVLEDGEPVDLGIHANEYFLSLLDYVSIIWPEATLVIEMIACYGMPVGAEVFDTCVWIGRFRERFHGPVEFVYRKDVKMNLCQSMRAKDANIRQAVIDRFGGKESGVGNKKSPGPLYGAKKDIWAAIAVGLTYMDEINAGLREAADTGRGEAEV
tara:strand:+ start:1585 stop:2124 length:540 start_codon:yes stop_codon:yes gene_type:complete